MAFDGVTLSALCRELSTRLTGGRVFKIAQTDSNELVLTIKPTMEQGGGQVRLYLCADPSLPLVYLTSVSRQAPLQAPSFCMLLRKHLQGGRIVSITQPGLERTLRIAVEHRDEMGDLTTHTLVIEIMGKHSNIIFLDDTDTIVDAIRRVSSMVSSVREVLPGRPYFIPETRGKINPFEETVSGFAQRFAAAGMPVAKLLLSSYNGLSTAMSEELVHRAGLASDRTASALSKEELAELWGSFTSLLEDIRKGRFTPTIYYNRPHEGQIGASPRDFSAVPMTIYADLPSEGYTSASEMLEAYYARKNADTRIHQKSADLRHIVQTILERDLHKYDLQRKQIRDTKKRDKYRIWGELLNAYGYGIEPGTKSVELDNYYTGEKTTVPLDPTLTPQQNAKKYFDRYAKLKRTDETLTSLTADVKAEIDHLESIRTSLDLATSEGDLAQIRQELEQSGFVRRHTDKKKGRVRTPQSHPLHYVSSDGYDIYVGKNNLQNDQLTFHFAQGSDIWFHANDMPGSHVILRSGGKKLEEIPDRAFEEAASLAAYYSSGRNQEKVEIDYLERRNVKKPGGARPGFVVYYTNYSIIARTDISALKLIPEKK